MDDEHDDDRARDESAAAETPVESEYRAETEDRERLESPVSDEPAPSVPEEPKPYTPEEYQLAQQIKARRLYKEENSRFPYTDGELSHFLMKANIERPIKPDDEDLEAARRKLEAAGS